MRIRSSICHTKTCCDVGIFADNPGHMKTQPSQSVNAKSSNTEQLVKDLAKALEAQRDGDSTAIDGDRMPGAAKKAYEKEVRNSGDGEGAPQVEAESFTYHGQTYYAVSVQTEATESIQFFGPKGASIGKWFSED